jgi:hypothetical protein
MRPRSAIGEKVGETVFSAANLVGALLHRAEHQLKGIAGRHLCITGGVVGRDITDVRGIQPKSIGERDVRDPRALSEVVAHCGACRSSDRPADPVL